MAKAPTAPGRVPTPNVGRPQPLPTPPRRPVPGAPTKNVPPPSQPGTKLYAGGGVATKKSQLKKK